MRWAIPAATRRGTARKRRGVLQRHRQRPSTRAARNGQRQRADARGAADRTRRAPRRARSGTRRPDPRTRGWSSVRRAATVREGTCLGSLEEPFGRLSRSGRPRCQPVLSRSAGASAAEGRGSGRLPWHLLAVDRLRRTGSAPSTGCPRVDVRTTEVAPSRREWSQVKCSEPLMKCRLHCICTSCASRRPQVAGIPCGLLRTWERGRAAAHPANSRVAQRL